jgi:hypothetical protein
MKEQEKRQEEEIKKRDIERTESLKQAALEELLKAQGDDETRIRMDESKAIESKEGQLLYDSNTIMITKFLEIAERKVSILDDYGDENWDASYKEVDRCIAKIARQNGLDMDWLELPGRYHWLWDRLMEDFRKYHETQRSAACPIRDVSGISGVDFETFVARRLKENGYEDVRGTPATGDQGADLIAKKNGRTIIIQAKRYHGTVGNKAVQEVNGAVSFYGGDEGWVITNSTFTLSARALAQKTNVRLFEGKDLERLDKILRNS